MSPAIADYYGSTQTLTFSSDTDLHPGAGRHVRADPSMGGLSLDLVAATSKAFKPGGPIAFIENISAFSLTLKDVGGNTIGTIAALTTCTLLLLDNSTANGDWHLGLCALTNVTGATTAPVTTTTTAPPTSTTTAPITTPQITQCGDPPGQGARDTCDLPVIWQTLTFTIDPAGPTPTAAQATTTPEGEHFEGAANNAWADQVNEGL